MFIFKKKVERKIELPSSLKKRKVLKISLFVSFFALSMGASALFGFYNYLEVKPRVQQFFYDQGYISHLTSGGQGLTQALKNGGKLMLKNWRGYIFPPNPPLKTLSLDIKFKHLHKLYLTREKHLKRGLIFANDDDYIPFKITYGNEEIKAKARIKGDLPDHLLGDKWSLRIKLKGGTAIDGMRVFSLQHPKTRGFQWELVYNEIMRKFGVIAPRFEFYRVFINGEDRGVYLAEEHFRKELVESHQRKEAPLLKFEEGRRWLAYERKIDQHYGYQNAQILAFGLSKIEESPVLFRNYQTAVGMLRGFVEGKLSASEVFDVDLIGNFLAISEFFEANHGLIWNNMRFFYNPISMKIEPVAFDAATHEGKTCGEYLLASMCWRDGLAERWLKDERIRDSFLKAISHIGKKLTDPVFRDELAAVEEKALNLMRPDYPIVQKMDWKKIENRIADLSSLTPKNFLSLRYPATRTPRPWVDPLFVAETKKEVEFINNLAVPLHIDKITIQNDSGEPLGILNLPKDFKTTLPAGNGLESQVMATIPRDLYPANTQLIVDYTIGESRNIKRSISFPYQRSFNKVPLSPLNEQEIKKKSYLALEGKTIRFKRGRWNIHQSLILPEGYEVTIPAGTILRFAQSTFLMIRGPLQVEGKKTSPVIIEGQTSKGFSGVLVFNRGHHSKLSYLKVRRPFGIVTETFSKDAGLTLDQGDVSLSHVTLEDVQTEDALNIVRANFDIKNLTIDGSFSDAFDCDFCLGTISDSFFNKVGGDGFDVSGSNVEIVNSRFRHIKDKAISSGEASKVIVRKADVRKAGTGVASKDASYTEVYDSTFQELGYAGLMSYVKKPEYGPAEIRAVNVELDSELESLDRSYLAQTGSRIFIGHKQIKERDLDVDKLYKEGPMKKY